MRQIEDYQLFVVSELKKFLPERTSAYNFQVKIGKLMADFRDNIDNINSWTAVEKIYYWFKLCNIKNSNEFDFSEYLIDPDGTYTDDDCRSSLSEPIFSVVELIAAYGLWFVNVEMECCGSWHYPELEEPIHNALGFTKAQVIEHKSVCLLNAYQAVSCANKSLLNDPPTDYDRARSSKINFVAMNQKRWEPNDKRKAEVFRIYDGHKWPSRRKAAATIVPLLNEFCDSQVPKIPKLSVDRASTTIYEWILAYTNNKRPPEGL